MVKLKQIIRAGLTEVKERNLVEGTGLIVLFGFFGD